jgi:antitoxin VapB
MLPHEFELEGNEAVIHRDDGRLIIEPVVKGGLLALLVDWKATDDSLANIDDPPVTPEDIF